MQYTKVRAKFRVSSIADYGYSKTVKLSAVSPGDSDAIAEDERFHKATPSGSIEISIDKPSAAEKFVVGQCLYVEFTPIPAAN